ncbi:MULTISPECIES: DUF6326 family protein [unclassified Nocardioides]|uniref:DUF6326 family protein n=1 Tax=unclassified Nocardioides TaxID=2615069 RepID=UPI0009F0D014|nr:MULTISPECIES: DUF6326 family protein [unclassified Nocardioides]GAW51768.1 Putative uncharacterized protein (Precursor) [Nocardioides sp. PD653-B2]GAW55264.1 putative uncharacterized protein (Precursor) [Nocardioides sp. PD653]
MRQPEPDVRILLSTLWIFATLNYLYCDVLSLMDSHLLRQYLVGTVGDIEMTQTFLVGAAVLMEIPIGMVLVSRVAGYRVNRWANIVAGSLMTAVQAITVFVGSTTPYYAFFSVVEIATTASIVWLALRWHVAPVVRDQPLLATPSTLLTTTGGVPPARRPTTRADAGRSSFWSRPRR